MCSEGMLTLVTGNDYPPFTDKALPKGGMTTEIITTVFANLGYRTEVSYRPWKRGRDETKNAKFVATFPYIHTDEREKDFLFSEPLHTLRTRIFVSNQSSINNIEDLDSKRICIPLGFGVTQTINEFLGKNIIREKGNPVDLAGCLKMIQSGRKDFFVLNETNGWITIQNTYNSRNDFRVLDAIVEEETEHLLISKSYPDGSSILNRFNSGLTELRESKVYDEIRNRHLRQHNLLK